MQHAVTIAGTDHRFLCREDRSVLAAMMDCGQQAVAVGCRSGGCGICRVEVIEGDYRTGQMSSAHISPSDRVAGFALACQLFPSSPLMLRVPPRRRSAADESHSDTFERMRQQCLAMTRVAP